MAQPSDTARANPTMSPLLCSYTPITLQAVLICCSTISRVRQWLQYAWVDKYPQTTSMSTRATLSSSSYAFGAAIASSLSTGFRKFQALSEASVILRRHPCAALAGSLRAGQATKDPLPVTNVGVADPSQVPMPCGHQRGMKMPPKRPPRDLFHRKLRMTQTSLMGP